MPGREARMSFVSDSVVGRKVEFLGEVLFSSGVKFLEKVEFLGEAGLVVKVEFSDKVGLLGKVEFSSEVGLVGKVEFSSEVGLESRLKGGITQGMSSLRIFSASTLLSMIVVAVQGHSSNISGNIMLLSLLISIAVCPFNPEYPKCFELSICHLLLWIINLLIRSRFVNTGIKWVWGHFGLLVL